MLFMLILDIPEMICVDFWPMKTENWYIGAGFWSESNDSLSMHTTADVEEIRWRKSLRSGENLSKKIFAFDET